MFIWDVAKANAPLKVVNLDAKVGYDIEWSKDKSFIFASTFGSKVMALDAKSFDILDQSVVTKD